ncbi:MAG TPA: ATP-binding protein [Polyangia bacterium]|nr:ATP-binding protein [Polyangia bacterium]
MTRGEDTIRWAAGRRAFVVGGALAALLCTSAFEWLKEALLPSLSRWSSHTLTIFFVTAGAAAMSALVHRAGGRLWREVEALEGGAKRNEAALQAFVDAIPEPAFLVDRRHGILMLNDALARRLRRPVADVLGRNVFQLLDDPELARRRAAHVSRVFDSGEPVMFRDCRGDRHYVNHVCPVRGPDGAIWAAGVVAIDVTDLQKARDLLERKEELLRFGLEAAHLGVWEWDIGTDVITVSPEALTRLGGPARTWRVPFSSFLDHLDARDRARVEASLRTAAAGRALAEPLLFRGRATHQLPMRWAEIQGRVYKSEGGRVRMVGTVGDATTRIESEARRLRAEQALGSVTQGTAAHTGQGFFSSLVEALARSLGARWALAGRFKGDGGTFETMAAWADGPAANLAVAAPLDADAGAAVSWSRRWLAALYERDPRRGGFTGLPHVVEVPIVGPDGQLLGLVAALDDKPLADLDTVRLVLVLSAVRAGAEIQRLDKEAEIMRLNADLERRVAERTTELTAANRELEAFSYSVSHDLRAPLRSIDGFALALLEDHGDALAPGARQYIDIVRHESQRMGQLIDDLLGLARLSRGTLSRGPVDLSAIAADIVGELRRRHGGRSVRVVIAPDMRLRGDANLLRIALENLIGNAWKFTSRRDDARVEIAMQADGPHRSISVSDNGAGFDPRLAAKLFQPFARLHAASEYEGTGIGLATVARIIKRHGGSVRAASQPGAGATFVCTLPDSAPDLAADARVDIDADREAELDADPPAMDTARPLL